MLYSFEVAETGIRTYFMNLSGKVQQSMKFHRRYVSGFGGILGLRPLNQWPVSWNSCQLTKVSNIWIFLNLGCRVNVGR